MAQRLRTLTGLDAAFLYLEASGTPMHVGSLMLLQAPKKRAYDFHRALTNLIDERLPRAAALRRVLNPAPLELGHPMWLDGGRLDLEKHIVRRKLRAPGTLAELNRLVARLHAEVLDRERPMWQFVVIDGLADGSLALYSKIHHALLDGQGGIALARALLDLTPITPHARKAGAEPAAAKAPRRRDLAQTAVRATLGQFAKLVRALPATIRLARDAAGEAGSLIGRLRDSVLLAPRTRFNVTVGPERTFATASLSLDAVKAVARGYGVTLNDVVMSLCSGALREFLLANKELPDEPLIAAMPVSLREAGNTEANNQVSMVQCSLATDIADPVERLRAIHLATGQIKARVAAFRSLIPTDFPGLAAPLWASGLSRLWARGHVAEHLPPLANLVISNVPGPPVPLFLAGARLLHYYPVSIVVHGLALNFTLQSYDGRLEFGLIACRQALPKADGLIRGLNKELKILSARMPR